MLNRKTLFVVGCVLLLVGLALWALSGFPTTASICEQNPQTHNQECASYHIAFVTFWHIAKFLDDHNGVTAFATGAIAAFTYTLYKATTGLVDAAKIQSEDMKDSIRAAENSAVATQRSAEINERVLTDLERPWIFVHLDPHLGGEDDHKFKLPYATFEIANHGRMPAIINECSVTLGCGELEPEAPILRDEFHGTLGPAERRNCRVTCPEGIEFGARVDLGTETSWPIPQLAQNEEFFFYIVVGYMGVGHYIKADREPYVSSFCWRYDRGVDYWVKFEPNGDQRWNCLT